MFMKLVVKVVLKVLVSLLLKVVMKVVLDDDCLDVLCSTSVRVSHGLTNSVRVVSSNIETVDESHPISEELIRSNLLP